MTYRQKQISTIAIVAVVVTAGVIFWWYQPANNANVPGGTWWICKSESCKQEFSLSMAQLSDHHEKHYGQPVPCAKCGSASVKADKCPSCGKVFVMQRDSTKCPACGKSTAEQNP
jgi:hypothetical protein